MVSGWNEATSSEEVVALFFESGHETSRFKGTKLFDSSFAMWVEPAKLYFSSAMIEQIQK